MKRYGRRLAVLTAALTAFAAFGAPRLKPQAEVVVPGALKARLLVGAESVPAPTPEARLYILRRGEERTNVKWYAPAEIWRQHERLGEWKDRQGNVIRIARVTALVPTFEREDWYLEEIEKGIAESEKTFKGTEEELAAWKRAWGSRGTGRFVTSPKGARYYVELEVVEIVREAEIERLMNALAKSVVFFAGKTPGAASLKWWEHVTPRYKYISDMEKKRGERFIKDFEREIGAMRSLYEFYVPPTGEVGVGTVRLFKTLEGYREYRASTGFVDNQSDGIWDPSREELLIAADNPKRAVSTMRHEAFHQYLDYATGRADHAIWFNEGHATFFENVKFTPRGDAASVIEQGNRAMWIDQDPVRFANAMFEVVCMTPEQFYSGDINLHYCAAWGLMYFLEKGAYTAEEFAPYREVCSRYLEQMRAGAGPAEATLAAWAPVTNLNLAENFLKFWTKYRKAAGKVRPEKTEAGKTETGKKKGG